MTLDFKLFNLGLILFHTATDRVGLAHWWPNIGNYSFLFFFGFSLLPLKLDRTINEHIHISRLILNKHYLHVPKRIRSRSADNTNGTSFFLIID